MLKNKIVYGFLILFVGFAMSIDTANAQVTGEEEVQSQTSFSGLVVDASSGQPLADVTVKVKDQDQETTTDQEGKFTFENLNLDPQGGEYEEGGEMGGNVGITIEINHDGYESFSQTVRPDEMMQDQTGDMGDPQAPADEQLMRFELQPKASS